MINTPNIDQFLVSHGWKPFTPNKTLDEHATRAWSLRPGDGNDDSAWIHIYEYDISEVWPGSGSPNLYDVHTQASNELFTANIELFSFRAQRLIERYDDIVQAAIALRENVMGFNDRPDW